MGEWSLLTQFYWVVGGTIVLFVLWLVWLAVSDTSHIKHCDCLKCRRRRGW